MAKKQTIKNSNDSYHCHHGIWPIESSPCSKRCVSRVHQGEEENLFSKNSFAISPKRTHVLHSKDKTLQKLLPLFFTRTTEFKHGKSETTPKKYTNLQWKNWDTSQEVHANVAPWSPACCHHWETGTCKSIVQSMNWKTKACWTVQCLFSRWFFFTTTRFFLLRYQWQYNLQSGGTPCPSSHFPCKCVELSWKSITIFEKSVVKVQSWYFAIDSLSSLFPCLNFFFFVQHPIKSLDDRIQAM